MKVFTTPTFTRTSKKLHPREKRALDQAVSTVLTNPEIGEPKKGDLAGVFIYKYKMNAQLWLLAYSFEPKEHLTLLLVGPHENFYRDLKAK